MARGLTETIQFLLKLDARGAAAEMEKFGQSADKNLSKAETDIDKLGTSFQRTGAMMVTAGTIAAAGLVKAANASQALNMAAATTERVFGDASDVMNDFAQDSVRSFGLSERAYREATNKLGAFLTNLGFDLPDAARKSNDLLAISTDLAASFGTTTTQAIDAIAAALRGERDPIEQFGIAIKQVDVNARIAADGLDTSTTAAKKNADAVATLSLITDQAGKFQGAYADEANQAARAQAEMRAEFENAAAALGQAVIPILTQAAQFVTMLVSRFNELPAPIRNTISKTAALGTGVLVLGGSFLFVIGKMIEMRDRLGKVGQAMDRLPIANLKGKLGALAVAITAAAIAWKLLNNTANASEQGDLERRSQGQLRFAESLDKVTGAMTEQTRVLLSNELAALGVSGKLAEAGLTLDKLDGLVRQGHDGWRILGEELDAAGVSGRQQGDVMELLINQYGLAITNLDELSGLLPEVGSATGDVADETDKLAKRYQLQRDAVDKLVGSINDLLAKQREQQDALREGTQATIDAFRAQLDVESQTRDTAAAFDEYRRVLAETPGDIDAVKDAEERAMREALALADAVVAMANAHEKDLTGGFLSAQEEAALYSSALSGLLAQTEPGSPLRAAIEGLIADLNQDAAANFQLNVDMIALNNLPTLVADRLQEINDQEATVSVGVDVADIDGVVTLVADRLQEINDREVTAQANVDAERAFRVMEILGDLMDFYARREDVSTADTDTAPANFAITDIEDRASAWDDRYDRSTADTDESPAQAAFNRVFSMLSLWGRSSATATLYLNTAPAERALGGARGRTGVSPTEQALLPGGAAGQSFAREVATPVSAAAGGRRTVVIEVPVRVDMDGHEVGRGVARASRTEPFDIRTR